MVTLEMLGMARATPATMRVAAEVAMTVPVVWTPDSRGTEATIPKWVGPVCRTVVVGMKMRGSVLQRHMVDTVEMRPG